MTSGPLRLPLVECDEQERAHVNNALAQHGLLAGAHRALSGLLRVLPLGGVGEIGKNLTVVEYDGRIVVVDCGLRFPTAEMMGIDLVLPDFTYLRENVDAIEAFVITHGHEDHIGALPWVIRDLGQDKIPVVYSGQLTIAMARSKLDEHKLRDVHLEVLPIGDTVDAGPFEIERVHLTHSIPDASRHRAQDAAGHRALHRRLQVRPDAGRRRARGHGAPGRARPRGRAAAVRRLHERRPPGHQRERVDRRPAPGPRVQPLQGPHRRHLLRVEHPPRPAGRARRRSRTDRKVALVGRSMRKNVNIGRSLGHIDIPEGMLLPPREIDQWADEKIVVISTGSQGEPLSALRRMAYRDHPQVELKRGDTVVFSATPIPGNERAVNETIDRLYHIGCEVVTARDAPIHASGHGYAEEVKMMINLTRPKYVMPVHGDFKRMLIHSRAGRGGGRPAREHLPHRERNAPGNRRRRRPLRGQGAGRDDLRRRRGHRRRLRRRAARSAHAVRGRHLHHRGHGLRAGRLVGRPARGARPRRPVPGGQHRPSSTSCARRSRTRWTAPPSSR